MHGRLVSLCIQQQTGDKLATICRRHKKHVDGDKQVDTTCIRQHVSWCKRGVNVVCTAAPYTEGRVEIKVNYEHITGHFETSLSRQSIALVLTTKQERNNIEQEGWLSPTERASVSAISLRHILAYPGYALGQSR